MTKVDKLNFKFNLDLGGASDSEDDDTKTEKTTARSEKIENDEPPPKPKKDKEKSKLSIKTLKDPSKFVTIGGMLFTSCSRLSCRTKCYEFEFIYRVPVLKW